MMYGLSETLKHANGKPLRIVIPAVYAVLFMLLLALALIESFLPFTINIPPIYTADIPLGLYLAYLISYPGILMAEALSFDTTSNLYIPVIFSLSLLFYYLAGWILSGLHRWNVDSFFRKDTF